MNATEAGCHLADCAVGLATGRSVREFEKRNGLGEVERSRFEFGLVIVNTVACVHMANMMPQQGQARAVIDGLYNRYFDVLGDLDSSVRIGDYIVDPEEFNLLQEKAHLDLSPDTLSNLQSIAFVIYHSRQVEYLELIRESTRERDLLGPMGGVALRFYEQLTGSPYDDEDDPVEGARDEKDGSDSTSLSPVDLSILLGAFLLELGEEVKKVRSAL